MPRWPTFPPWPSSTWVGGLRSEGWPEPGHRCTFKLCACNLGSLHLGGEGPKFLGPLCPRRALARDSCSAYSSPRDKMGWPSGCVIFGTGAKSTRTSNHRRIMRRQTGTSRSYILDRLREAGLIGLIEAIETNRVSAFAVGVELGWLQRPPLRGGSPNKAKRRRFEIQRLIREGRFNAIPPSRS